MIIIRFLSRHLFDIRPVIRVQHDQKEGRLGMKYHCHHSLFSEQRERSEEMLSMLLCHLRVREIRQVKNDMRRSENQ